MVALAVALALALVPTGPRVAFVHRGSLVVLDLATGNRQVVLRHAGGGPVRWSGDGRLVSSGGDRYAVHAKSIVLDARDVSRDSMRSWVSPACSADGRILVASASRNRRWELMGDEHRSIWQLRPVRRRLTRPPAGWTDENPRVVGAGSILFVRTRQVPRGTSSLTERGTLELLRNGRLTPLADVGFTTSTAGAGLYATNYYGHYGWPSLIAVAQ